MAYSIMKQSGETTYGISEFIINNASEISTVPTDCGSGSVTLDIATGNVYLLSVITNNVKEWKLLGDG